MNRKLIVIDSCGQCPYFEHDAQDIPELWGKCYCHKVQKELTGKGVDEGPNIGWNIPIPDWCPLENTKE